MLSLRNVVYEGGRKMGRKRNERREERKRGRKGEEEERNIERTGRARERCEFVAASYPKKIAKLQTHDNVV